MCIRDRYVLNGGTEPAFSSPLNDIKQSGDFVCARKGCDAVLFRTDTKYDSGTGWPSFWDPVDDNVKLEKGNFMSFMFGTECKCRKCDGHLGHRFDDGPIMKSGKRYCIDGAALTFSPADGSGVVIGEAPSRGVTEPELPSWLQPPKPVPNY